MAPGAYPRLTHGIRYVTPALSGADITPVEWNSRSGITVPGLMPYPVQISGRSPTLAAFSSNRPNGRQAGTNLCPATMHCTAMYISFRTGFLASATPRTGCSSGSRPYRIVMLVWGDVHRHVRIRRARHPQILQD